MTSATLSAADRNKAIVQEAYAGAMQGNWDSFFEHFHPEVLTIVPDSLPHGGTYYGIEGARRAIDTALNLWDQPDFRVEEICASDSMAFIYLYMTGTGKITRETFSMPIVETWRFREGKTVELRAFYVDTLRARRCFGVGAQ